MTNQPTGKCNMHVLIPLLDTSSVRYLESSGGLGVSTSNTLLQGIQPGVIRAQIVCRWLASYPSMSPIEPHSSGTQPCCCISGTTRGSSLPCSLAAQREMKLLVRGPVDPGGRGEGSRGALTNKQVITIQGLKEAETVALYN